MNPKDKNGNVLNIGDSVVYMKGTPDEDFGVIASMCDKRHELWVEWSDSSVLYIKPGQVELIESSVTADTFTPEDEALLQKLLAKKEQANKLREDADNSLADLVNEMYEVSKECTLHLFVIENIDEICATLQAYKQHCM